MRFPVRPGFCGAQLDKIGERVAAPLRKSGPESNSSYGLCLCRPIAISVLSGSWGVPTYFPSVTSRNSMFVSPGRKDHQTLSNIHLSDVRKTLDITHSNPVPTSNFNLVDYVAESVTKGSDKFSSIVSTARSKVVKESSPVKTTLLVFL